MILILTSPHDVHADRVAECLDAKRAEFLRFDPAEYPATLTMSSALPTDDVLLKVNAKTVGLAEVTAVWLRRPSAVKVSARIQDPWMAGYAKSESELVLEDTWEWMECSFIPARPRLIRRADSKFMQLSIARRLGLTVPDTLITNDPPAARDFFRRHEGRVISKLPGNGVQHQPRPSLRRFTEKVTRRDFAYFDSVGYAPVTFQAYAEKAFEVRVTVVGARVFAAAIYSQHSERTAVDWRRYDVDQTPYEIHELPCGIREKCVRLVDKLGLAFGAIDFVVTPNGEYVFLEINPNGQFLWIENRTGLPIAEAVADLLISSGSDRGVSHV